MAKNKKCDGFFSNFFLACIEKIMKSMPCVWRYVLSAAIHSPPRHTQTPAPRASIPLRHISHICRRQMSLLHRISPKPAKRASIPPRQIANARAAGVFSPTPFMKRGIGREVTTPMASADQMDWILGDNVMIVDTGSGAAE